MGLGSVSETRQILVLSKAVCDSNWSLTIGIHVSNITVFNNGV